MFVTFGQEHTHKVNGVIFDKDCICEIPANNYDSGIEKVKETFGDKYSFTYKNVDAILKFFPRGIIKLEL